MLSFLKKKKSKKQSDESGKKENSKQKLEDQLAGVPGAPDTKDMNFMEKMAAKRLMKMSPEEQRKTLQKAMTPKNIAKHKDEIIQSLKHMKENNMISDDQYRLMKRKFGIKE